MNEDEAARGGEGTDGGNGSGCPVCANWKCDPDDVALISLGSGILSLIFGLFGMGRGVHLLAMPLGILAVHTGYTALKKKTQRGGAALRGLAFGVAGIGLFLVTLGVGAMWHALFG